MVGFIAEITGTMKEIVIFMDVHKTDLTLRGAIS